MFTRIPRGLVILGAAVLSWFIVLGGASAVFAQDIVVAVPPTEVVFNWGDWVAILLANVADPQSVAWTAVASAIAWLVFKLPGPAQWAFNVFKVDQLLIKALQAALNTTSGATAGKALNVNVGSEVLAKAIQYAVDNGQKWLIDWMGGRAGVEQKLLARMELDGTVDGNALVTQARALEGLRVVDPVPATVTTVKTKAT